MEESESVRLIESEYAVGIEFVRMIENLADEKLWKKFGKPYDEFVYGQPVFCKEGGDAVSERDWDIFWLNYPEWYEKAYILADNGEYSFIDVAYMDPEEICKAYERSEGSCENVYYTVKGD